MPVHQMGYLTDLLGSRAVDVISSYARSTRPFLLSLHFNAPHWPWEAPGDQAESERVLARHDLQDFDGGTQKTYQRMVESMDLQVGRVLSGAGHEPLDPEHDRHLHQRQRRRAFR